ncbi:MAG: 4Fe-4S dicluster domain-containing protein [Desulfobacterales bacterium]|nr:4Fe-4S dicluster domain-containing protein [Desulfobacterales bacterium]MDD4073621.1 4Fe-4S dicluster domain-containing protein [Desulfobacterales bacterium]MDD4393651.1 4Fe-4S dicluster domain-containing protein [Desulfobacterales bacterium]
MKWTSEAESAIVKVPYFIRNKVRSGIEKDATDAGKAEVTLVEVETAQKRHMDRIQSAIKGYQLDRCFGSNGCPNRANNSDNLIRKIEELLIEEDILSFLKYQVKDKIKFHHEMRISISECPNACSQPQIRDIGIIGVITPEITDKPCSDCRACIRSCPDSAITLEPADSENEDAPDYEDEEADDYQNGGSDDYHDKEADDYEDDGSDDYHDDEDDDYEDDDSETLENQVPVIDYGLCMRCGRCTRICPSGAIIPGKSGYRIQLGGKLGRHPQLAMELPGQFTEEEVLKVIQACIIFYKMNSRNGKRFASIFHESDYMKFVRIFGKADS